MKNDLLFLINEALAKVMKMSLDDILLIPDENLLEEYGLESLKFVEFIVAMEESLRVDVDDMDLDMSKFSRKCDMAKTLSKYVSAKRDDIVKCIITDCDNCLWGGIAADDGIDNINIEGIFSDYQKALVTAASKGIVIAICSKNEESIVNDVFCKRTDMILKESHVVIAHINWEEKYVNIAEIASELNISTGHIVFVDDDIREIARINDALPDVRTILFASEASEEISTLASSLPDIPTLESKTRTGMFKEEKQRTQVKQTFIEPNAYLHSLETELVFSKAGPEDIPRLYELSQRTNQFNLNESRYSEAELSEMLSNNNCDVITLTAKDRFGSLGLCAYCVINYVDNAAVIDGFMISCRVFSRHFENIFVEQIQKIASLKGCTGLVGLVKLNDKNQRFKNIYLSKGFSNEGSHFVCKINETTNFMSANIAGCSNEELFSFFSKIHWVC